MAAEEHDVEHLARLIGAATRVRVGTVTGTLTGFRSGQTLTMADDDGRPYDMPWASDLLQLEAIDRMKLAQAQEAQQREHEVAMAAKRAVYDRPESRLMTSEQVAEAVRAEIDRGTVSP